ncbi:S41 family peptidase [Agarilytica rhodophyticola]|uniref:S41 family peptidase n=1 Tax=Agarilytica rhodophyticola TaxID=1737490 RepID=UPI000B346CE7|nr:S41 family peptidase [Agarilytica rhodophyticola]
MKYKNIFLLGALLSGVVSFAKVQATPQDSTRLLRFPDIHKNYVTFVYGGDIYISSTKGGLATKLTSDEGSELFPKFSPDGKKIAFSAEYSGNRQVYVMNADGSDLTQLTYYNDVGKMPPRGGFDYRVLDWTPDGKNILVRGNRLPWGPRMGRPMLVPVEGGMAQDMAVPEGGGGMLSPDGNRLLYTPIDREWRTWKRHRGGRAQDVWIYNLNDNTSEQLTTSRATDQQPVWVGDNIYFASDRAYTLNLYRYQKDGEPVQQTFHKEFDVLWPSAGPDAVVYQNGGYLYRFDPASEKAEKMDIKVAGARPHRQPVFKNVAAFTDTFDLSHDGKRALFASRGELFTVPEKNGPTRNISNTPSAREISASWSPDGKNIVFLSDASGEYEIYMRSQNGKGTAKQLTKDSNIWLFPPVWSGSSDKLAWSDANQKLWVMSINGKAVEVDRGRYGDIEEYQFSADGRYLGYVKQAQNGLAQIWLYDSKSNSTRKLSDNQTSDFSPVFDPKGRYLYFLSNRDYNLNFSSYEFNYLYHDATRIYAAPLNDTITMPGALSSDEVGEAKSTDGKGKKDKKSDKAQVITLNAKKMRDHAVALVAKAGDYQQLSANDEGVLVIAGNGGSGKLTLVTVDEKAKSEVIASKIDSYRLAAGGKKVLVKQGKDFSIIDAKAKQKPENNRLSLKHLHMRIDPEIEWAQMYRDAWRTLRDWFYDPNMHGQDWQKIYDKYQPLVAHAAHRSDLDFILSEVAGEMNAGHIYVQSGDEPSVKRIEGGLLGAEIASHTSGNFQIKKIFRGENWHDNFRSPLTQAGVNVSEGEFILAVNGIASNTVKNFYQLMENTAGKITTLTVAATANGKNTRDVLVKPIKRETSLRYLDWVASRAAYVDKLSNGRVGYIHLPNTAIDGNRELFKQFLPQINKEALIIDDRYNGGGFIPEHMIAMLSREPLNYWKRRGTEPLSTPFYQHTGPKAMLVNGYSSSGGDALPYYFRKNGLGKIIGTRTWGGLIGISGNPRLVDGGQVLASTFRFLDTEGKWAVENEGVTPDIEVLDRPELIHQGKDPSIERAVNELLKELPASPAPAMKAPPAPTKF